MAGTGAFDQAISNHTKQTSEPGYQPGGQQQQSTENAPSGNAPSSATSASEGDILNLDGSLKFKFEGREWTPEQLKKSVMMHSDYTKKTQAVAEKAKYFDNLEYDLENVRSNPKLAEEFVKIYPKEFHKYLNLSRAQSQQAAEARQVSGNQSENQLPPELLQDIKSIKEYVNETQVKAHEAQIDATFQTLSKKYPDGIEDVVLARAQALLDRGTPIDSNVWERLWKQSHDDMNKRFETRQKTTLQTQRNSNARAQGPGAGGGTPSGSPKKMNLKEAEAHMINSLKGRG